MLGHGGVVFEQTVHAVLHDQFPFEHSCRVAPHCRCGSVAQPRSDGGAVRRQQRADSFQPFPGIVGAGARFEVQRQPFAAPECGGEVRGKQRAQRALIRFEQRAATHHQISRPFRQALHRYASKSRWNKVSSSSLVCEYFFFAPARRSANSSNGRSTSPACRPEVQRSRTRAAKSCPSSSSPKMASISPTTNSNMLILSCSTRSNCSSTEPPWQ